MADLSKWDELIAGKGCPFCEPREAKNEFSITVEGLSVSTLFLSREQTYRGYCFLIFKKRHVTGLEQLSDDEYRNYMADLQKSMKAVFNAVNPDHMNYATLGNSIPHLHYHIIPRYKNDPRWRVNPFGDTPPKNLNDEGEYDRLADEIRKHF